jgi:hypothetical protein
MKARKSKLVGAREAARVMKDGGRILAITYGQGSVERHVDQVHHHRKLETVFWRS